MTAIGLLLSSVLVFSDVAGHPRDAVPDAAPCCITGVVTFVSSTVRNSGVIVLYTQGPEKVLKSIAEKISSGKLITVRVRLAGLPQHLAESVFSEMVFIVQEAITNAIKHGHAKTVVLASDSSESGFTLRIANDGEPFDPDKALGPEAGHYGLSGMRERAKRAGIKLSFVRDSRLMVVVLDVPA